MLNQWIYTHIKTLSGAKAQKATASKGDIMSYYVACLRCISILWCSQRQAVQPHLCPKVL